MGSTHGSTTVIVVDAATTTEITPPRRPPLTHTTTVFLHHFSHVNHSPRLNFLAHQPPSHSTLNTHQICTVCHPHHSSINLHYSILPHAREKPTAVRPSSSSVHPSRIHLHLRVRKREPDWRRKHEASSRNLHYSSESFTHLDQHHICTALFNTDLRLHHRAFVAGKRQLQPSSRSSFVGEECESETLILERE